MDDCDCIGGQWATDDLLMRYQYVADFFIALAYFSIPLELVYFVKKSAVFPYRWVLVQFGAFITLCGATHLINMWTFREHSRTVAMVMTLAKLLTALVSCATALMLVHIIPDLLSAKTRELFLKNKAAELDREMGLIRTQEETGRHVRMLTQEIRSTLDRLTILKTTLVELGKALQLEECALWMPVRTGGGAMGGVSDSLQLMHTLTQSNPPALTVPLAHPTVKQVFSTSRAVVISPSSPVTNTGYGAKSPMAGSVGLGLGMRYSSAVGDAVGVRVPLLHTSALGTSGIPGAGAAGATGAERDWQESRERHYALLVLMLPAGSARRWHVHELEMVEVVADQVAVGLSHASILEESVRARDLLMQQNIALDHARGEAEKAIRARNDFLAVMNHEMRTPMHAIIALSTLLQETELTPEQRSMVDTVLKSSSLLATLIHDVLDLSHMDDSSATLNLRTFNVHALFREVASLVKPVASVKKVGVTLRIQSDFPEWALGDERRLLQTTLNVVGNAVKFTREGSVSLHVCLERSDFTRDRLFPKFNPVVQAGDKHFYIRVQVKDSGVGIRPEEQRRIFTKFAQADSTTTRNYGGSGLGLAISKRFVNKMGGHIWVESDGPGRGTTVTFVVRLGLPDKAEEKKAALKAGPKALVSAVSNAAGIAAADSDSAVDFTGLKVLVCDDNHVNRMVTKRMVSRLGCEVTVVGSGRECLAVLAGAGHGFKVLLQDLMMPDMDGYEVAKRIIERFKNKPEERPKIVALTANTDQETKERCLSIGMDGVITKPISLEKMQTVFTELIQLGKIVSDPKA